MGPTFSSESKRVLDRAEAEARTLEREFVGTEHLLLALVAEGHPALTTASVEDLRQVVIRLTGRGTGSITDLYVTPRLKHVLRIAVQVAETEGQDAVTVQHLWTGIAREGQGVAMALLSELGVDATTISGSASERG